MPHPPSPLLPNAFREEGEGFFFPPPLWCVANSLATGLEVRPGGMGDVAVPDNARAPPSMAEKTPVPPITPPLPSVFEEPKGRENKSSAGDSNPGGKWKGGTMGFSRSLS